MQLYCGLTAYAYGTSYFFLPFFVIIMLIVLLKKKINIKNAVFFLGIVGIVSLPIIIFVVINTFHLPEIKLPFLTIPRMVQNRYETVTTLFSKDFFINIIINLKNTILMLVTGTDGLPWNSVNGYGIVYIFSLPFTILGMLCEFRKGERLKNIFNLWFIISIAVALVVEININRNNIMMFPIIYYTIIGVSTAISKINVLKYFLIVIYIVYFVMFEYTYFSIDFSEYYTFSNGIEDVINYVEKQDEVEKIYFPYTIKEPYIYALFYAKINPNEYINSVKKKNENGTFENIKSFGRYEFYGYTEFIENSKYVYIIPKNTKSYINEDIWDKVEFEKYVVLRYKE